MDPDIEGQHQFAGSRKEQKSKQQDSRKKAKKGAKRQKCKREGPTPGSNRGPPARIL